MRKSLEMAKCSSSGLIRGKSYKVKHSFSLSSFCSFLPLFSPLDPNVSWLYIISFNASGLYTWRVGIVFLGYLSHQDLTSRPYTRVLAVQPLFAVTSPSMRPDSGCIAFNSEGMAFVSFLLLLFLVQCQVILLPLRFSPRSLYHWSSTFRG